MSVQPNHVETVFHDPVMFPMNTNGGNVSHYGSKMGCVHHFLLTLNKSTWLLY